jgi:competence ComEA-like helix-hairpin-helix protein
LGARETTPQERGLLVLLAVGLGTLGILAGWPRTTRVQIPSQEPIVAVGLTVVCPVVRPPRRINVNTAGTSELVELAGIGPVLAERIVAYRLENGPFPSLDEMIRVSGIGPATVEGFRDQAVLEDPPDQ